MTHTITVQPSGRTFTAEAGETVLDAALRHGIDFPYGCRNGVCGNCRGQLLSGTVHYAGEAAALTPEEQAEDWALFCQAQPTSDLTIGVELPESESLIPPRDMPAKVARMVRLSDDVMQLFLKLPEGDRLPFRAGQYVEFILEDGKRRAFSIANAPHDDALLEFHIRHIRGGRFTDPLFESMQEKQILRLEGPHGSFYLREESARPILMVATGTGFGPIKGIVEHAIAAGIERPIHIYWGARHRDGLYLDALVRSWSEQHANIHYTPVLSQPDAQWQGRQGYVQDVIAADFENLADYELYACGHPEMVLTARRQLVERGIDPAHCFADAFEWAKD